MNASQTSTDTKSEATNLPLLDAPEHVLSTLEGDGSRRWLRPRLSTGRWWQRRRVVAYVLIAIFVALPHLRIGGRPLILLDIAARKFVFLGHTFLPTDTLLLALLMVGIFVTIVLATALAGRVWCGWACPQTVYMEFLFRPIDRLFEKTIGKGGTPRRELKGVWSLARFGVYAVLCFLLANTFLAYFVGTDRLAQWMQSSPIEHPTAFLIMGATTGLMLFDFLFFREQLCLIACPYGRFQSVMLDRQSLIVAYDTKRGEPREKGKRSPNDGKSDCIDCKQCVVVCPTGIDIRDGLQMECINCTQCIDACDDVMEKINRPKGLIRYSSQDALAGLTPKLLRLRTILYPLLLLVVGIGFLVVLSTKYAFDARLIRAEGNPFNRIDNQLIVNNFRLRLVNRTDAQRAYDFEMISPDDAVIRTSTETISLDEGGNKLFPLLIQVPASEFGVLGQTTAEIKIIDDIGNQQILPVKLLGPRR